VNFTLAHFASVGSRCNFWGVYDPNLKPGYDAYTNERAYSDANRACTKADTEQAFGCFALGSRVMVRNFSVSGDQDTPRDTVKPISELSAGDYVLAPTRGRTKGGERERGGTAVTPERHGNEQESWFWGWGRGGVVVGDKVGWAKVVFVHEHAEARRTVRIRYRISQESKGGVLGGGGGYGQVEMSSKHLVPLVFSKHAFSNHAFSNASGGWVRVGVRGIGGVWGGGLNHSIDWGLRLVSDVLGSVMGGMEGGERDEGGGRDLGPCTLCDSVGGEFVPEHLDSMCDKCLYESSSSSNVTLVPAELVQVGDRILVQHVFAGGDALVLASVVLVQECSARVKYVVTDSDYIIVDGVAVSTFSTALAALETAPFRFIDWIHPGMLQTSLISAQLSAVMEVHT
jgi:hypothetical protein